MKAYDFTLQAVHLNQAREVAETAIAFFIAIVPTLLDRHIKDPVAVVGDMTVHDLLNKVSNLTERMQMALDGGAKTLLLPSENKRDIAHGSDDVLNKIRPLVYTEPTNAAI